ncbi:hypothetical protein ACWJKU_10930 [Methylocaldum sp. MU1018]
MIDRFWHHSVILGDTGFHAETGDPPNLKLCRRGEWNDRMLIETVLSMLTQVCHFKKVMHRVADYLSSAFGVYCGAVQPADPMAGLASG